MLKKLLAFAAIVEFATGLAVLIDPAIVVTLLLGAEISGVGIPVARCFGIGLLGLALACWPSGANAGTDTRAFRGMLVYNALIALFLAYLFVGGHLGGILLWPAVVLHAVVALLLVWTWRIEARTSAIGT